MGYKKFCLISRHSSQKVLSWHKLTDFNLVLKSKWLHPTLSMQRDQILLLKIFWQWLFGHRRQFALGIYFAIIIQVCLYSQICYYYTSDTVV